VVDEERMSPVGDFHWLGSLLLSSLQCLDTVGWVAERVSIHEEGHLALKNLHCFSPDFL